MFLLWIHTEVITVLPNFDSLMTGQWLRGRRHGWGEQVMIPDAQRGDGRRHFIGGVDALYRPVAYRGEWKDGSRTGQGIVVYSSGLEMAGELNDGRFEGVVKYIYPGNKRVRFALFRGGERVSWLGSRQDTVVETGDCTNAESILEEMLGTGSDALALFHDQSKNDNIPSTKSPTRVMFAT